MKHLVIEDNQELFTSTISSFLPFDVTCDWSCIGRSFLLEEDKNIEKERRKGNGNKQKEESPNYKEK